MPPLCRALGSQRCIRGGQYCPQSSQSGQEAGGRREERTPLPTARPVVASAGTLQQGRSVSVGERGVWGWGCPGGPQPPPWVWRWEVGAERAGGWSFPSRLGLTGLGRAGAPGAGRPAPSIRVPAWGGGSAPAWPGLRGCSDRIPQTGGLNNRYSPSSGGWESKVKVLAY